MTYSRRVAVENVDKICPTAETCVNAEPLAPLIVFSMTSLLALLIAATLAHIHSANGLIERERSRTGAERDAFAEFTRRVAALEASEIQTMAGTNGTVTPMVGSADGQLERVKDVYRNTVMAMDHYEEEYDEPLEVNMSAEFTEEVATAVADGTAFTPQIKEALVQQSRRACAQREEFLRQLDREAEDLDRSKRTLSDIEETLCSMNERPLSRLGFEDLVEAWGRLGGLESRLDDLLRKRQRTVHRQTGSTVDGNPTIQDYLYQSIPVRYPVLDAGTTLVDHVRSARRQVLSAITRRS